MNSTVPGSTEDMPSPIALRRGVLITFEGPDGSGKSTVAEACLSFLRARGYGPLGLFREPGQSEAGRRIRELSRRGRHSISPEEERDLFTQDRRWDLETNVEPILRQRGAVLLDRYYHSSIAYQGARGANPEEVRRLNEAFARRPDLVVLLSLGVDECLRRIRQARGDRPDLFEDRESLTQVCALFDAMDDPEIQRFDATQPPEVVQSQVNAAVVDVLAPLHI